MNECMDCGGGDLLKDRRIDVIDGRKAAKIASIIPRDMALLSTSTREIKVRGPIVAVNAR